VFTQFGLHAQFRDTLFYLKADLFILELENVVGPVSRGQEATLTRQITALRTQAASSEKGRNVRKKLRLAVSEVLTKEQKSKLKALKSKGGKDPFNQILAKMRRKQ